MDETAFYVLGIALVIIALVASFAGLRFEKFPPTRGILIGATLAITILVGATMTFAWRNAEDEQAHREAELAEDVAANEEAGDTTEADEEAGSAATEATTTPAVSAEGAQVFESAGCSGCHTLAAAGSTATTGPDLDGALAGKSEGYTEEAIVDPNAEIAEGYPPNVMPDDFGTRLSPEELDALVQYLVQSTSGQS